MVASAALMETPASASRAARVRRCCVKVADDSGTRAGSEPAPGTALKSELRFGPAFRMFLPAMSETLSEETTTPSSAPRRRRWPRVVLGLFLVLLAGLIGGGVWAWQAW